MRSSENCLVFQPGTICAAASLTASSENTIAITSKLKKRTLNSVTVSIRLTTFAKATAVKKADTT